MPFITHFESLEGDKLPIAAATQYRVAIPAAGSADLGGWDNVSTQDKYTYLSQQEIPADSVIIPACTDPNVFTEHGLTITYDEQGGQWVLQLDSLPAAEAVLYLLVHHAVEGGAI